MSVSSLVFALFLLLFVKFEKFVSNYSYLGVGRLWPTVINRYFKILIVTKSFPNDPSVQAL